MAGSTGLSMKQTETRLGRNRGSATYSPQRQLASGDDEFFANCVKDDFRSCVQIEFLHDVGAMRLDGVHTEVQDARDLFVRLALS